MCFKTSDSLTATGRNDRTSTGRAPLRRNARPILTYAARLTQDAA